MYDILLFRHHQCRQTLINNKTCKGFTYLSITPLFTRLKKKGNKKTCGIFGTALFCSAAFIGRAKFEQVKKEGARSFFSFIIHRNYYIQFENFYFRITERFASLAVHRLISEIVQFTTKGLRWRNLTFLALKSAFYYHTSLNFFENGCFLWIPFVRLL